MKKQFIRIILFVMLIQSVVYMSGCHTDQPADQPANSPDSLSFGSKRARVVDSAGKPIAGAVVEFGEKIEIENYTTNRKETKPLQAESVATDSEGVFPLPCPDLNLPPNGVGVRYNAKVNAVGFLTRDNIDLGGKYYQDKGCIDLLRPGSAEGFLLDPNGNPLANAPVSVRTRIRYSSPSSICCGYFDTSGTTDDNGYFKIDNLPPGQQFISYPNRSTSCDKKKAVPFENYAGFALAEVKEQETTSNIIIDLSKSTASIKGKVLDESGKPIQGAIAHAYIELITAEQGTSFTSTNFVASSDATDSNGNFNIQYLPPGTFKVRATYPYIENSSLQPDSGQWSGVTVMANQSANQIITLKRQDMSKFKKQIKIEARILFVSESSLTNLKDANVITDVNCGELLSEQQNDFVLRSIQSHRDAKLLTAPRVTVLDGEGATISITKDVNCITGYRQTGRFPFAKSRPIYETKTAGLIFKVNSKLKQNGCIKLNTDLTYTNIEPKGIKEQKKCRFPIIETVQSKSEVMIPNGQTLMFCGNKITEKFDCKKGEAKFKYIMILIKAKEINPAEKQTNKCGN
ncbi:MAG: hypothetical protein A2Y13_11190 [Planctomycetes bacterium GWC2_45_44]|nr:MAG: hypothetical protein A2Y13_11190 [Planctomycetes bacterium GWC2_45_44]